MKVTKKYDDYIKRKAACEDVISWAELFGRWLLQNKVHPETVLAILPDKSSVDYYLYNISQSEQLHLEGWQNDSPNNLSASLELDAYAAPSVRKWWDHVFFQGESGISYDGYYDDLRIAESSSLTFTQILSGIKAELDKIPIREVKHIYLPKDIVTHKPLLYILQREYSINVSPFPDLSTKSFSKGEYSIVDGKNQLVLKAGGGIPIDVLFKHNLKIQVPNDSGTLNSPALSGINWGSIISGNNIRYLSGGVEYFETMINAESDLFGNVFLNVFEFDKRIKCFKVS